MFGQAFGFKAFVLVSPSQIMLPGVDAGYFLNNVFKPRDLLIQVKSSRGIQEGIWRKTQESNFVVPILKL